MAVAAQNRGGGSILAADFGNVNTRVVLLDLVDGAYRLVARADTLTTSGFPLDDVSIGFRRAVENISHSTGRKLLESGEMLITPERPDRSGVETFVATSSTGRPLRTVLIGLVPEISLASGLRAAAGTYIQIVETISLDERRTEEERLNAILLSRPDLIFITGGTEGGAEETVLDLARTVKLAVTLLKSGRKPVVLYAGNSVVAPKIREMFAGLTRVFFAPNVRPALEDEVLDGAQLQLALAFDERSSARGAGFDSVSGSSRLGILPTAQSYGLIVEYLGHTLNRGSVLAVDVGSAVSVLTASVNGQLTTAIRTDIGLGHSAHNLLDVVGQDAVKRWLPFYVTRSQLQAYALNKTVRPSTIPETVRDLYIEHALLRAGVEALVKASRPAWNDALGNVLGNVSPDFKLVIQAGAALTHTGSAAYNAMLLLDALQPTGVTILQADSTGLISALGALAQVNQEAVVQVLDSGNLERLGIAFSVGGIPREGRTALKIKITTDDKEVIKHEVPGGHLWVYALPVGKTAKVEVSAGRGLNIGGKRRVKLTVPGGTAGLIFDGRGRPLLVAVDVRARALQLPLWVHEATGDPLREIDERWLTPQTEEEAPVIAAPKAERAAPKRERRRLGRRGKADDGQKGGTGRLRDLSEERQTNEEDDDMMDDLRNALS